MNRTINYSSSCWLFLMVAINLLTDYDRIFVKSEELYNPKTKRRSQFGSYGEQPEIAPIDPLDAISGYVNDMIPIDFYQKLNSIGNVSEFTAEFLNDLDQSEYMARQTDDVEINERSGEKIPKPANCMPEIQPVELKPDGPDDPAYLYFPSCTRIKQCGGCCNTKLLECQPTATNTLTFKLLKYQYTGTAQTKRVGYELVLIDEHTACKCDCRIKEEHCKTFQKYNKSKCICECVNTDDRDKCISNSDKIWDPTNCICRCRTDRQCTTGTFFDENLCLCQEPTSLISLTNQKQLADRRRLIIKATPIDPSTQIH